MPMMIDARCQCGKRIGWSGTFAQRPACPRCGWRPPQDELEAVDRSMEADRKRRATDPACAAGDVIRQQRVDAGLTLRQAAKLLEVTASYLSDLENGRDSPVGPYLAAKMVEVYGLEVS